MDMKKITLYFHGKKSNKQHALRIVSFVAPDEFIVKLRAAASTTSGGMLRAIDMVTRKTSMLFVKKGFVDVCTQEYSGNVTTVASLYSEVTGEVVQHVAELRDIWGP